MCCVGNIAFGAQTQGHPLQILWGNFGPPGNSKLRGIAGALPGHHLMQLTRARVHARAPAGAVAQLHSLFIKLL